MLAANLPLFLKEMSQLCNVPHGPRAVVGANLVKCSKARHGCGTESEYTEEEARV